MSTLSTDVQVGSLITFQIGRDGSHARVSFLDHARQRRCLVLPFECLNELLMTLPSMVQTSLRKRFADESFRLVYPLEDFRLELGAAGQGGVAPFILTLATTGGFSVSFSASHAHLRSLAQAIGESDRAQEELPRLS